MRNRAERKQGRQRVVTALLLGFLERTRGADSSAGFVNPTPTARDTIGRRVRQRWATAGKRTCSWLLARWHAVGRPIRCFAHANLTHAARALILATLHRLRVAHAAEVGRRTGIAPQAPGPAHPTSGMGVPNPRERLCPSPARLLLLSSTTPEPKTSWIWIAAHPGVRGTSVAPAETVDNRSSSPATRQPSDKRERKRAVQTETH